MSTSCQHQRYSCDPALTSVIRVLVRALPLCILLVASPSSLGAGLPDSGVSITEHQRTGRVTVRRLRVSSRSYAICPKADVDSCDENTIVDTNYQEFVYQRRRGSRADTMTLLQERASDLCYVRLRGMRIPLNAITMDTVEPASVDLSTAPAYRVSTRSRSYVCFIGSGTGLYQSGSFQSIRFYLIYDEATPNPVVILSAINSIKSLVDENRDDHLDFVRYSVCDTGHGAGALCASVLRGTASGFMPSIGGHRVYPPVDDPTKVIETFYHATHGLKGEGVPSHLEIDTLSRFLSAEFTAALHRARDAEDAYQIAASDPVPPMIEGCLFTSLFEGFTRVDSIARDSACPACYRVDLAHAGTTALPAGTTGSREQVSRWSDRVYLKQEHSRWVIDDIELTAHFSFGLRGMVRQILRDTENAQ